MNKLYNEGLMSPDFALDSKKETLTKAISTGKVGFFSEDTINIFYNDGTYDALKKNVPSASLTPVDAYTNKDGKHAKPLDAPNGMYIMIPKSSKNAVEAVKYLDWMATGDNLLTMLKGVKGQNYNLDANGIPAAIDNHGEELKTTRSAAAIWVFSLTDLFLIHKRKLTQLLLRTSQKDIKAMLRKALKIAVTDGIKQIISSYARLKRKTNTATTLMRKRKN